MQPTGGWGPQSIAAAAGSRRTCTASGPDSAAGATCAPPSSLDEERAGGRGGWPSPLRLRLTAPPWERLRWTRLGAWSVESGERSVPPPPP